jgi:hypothetical protein
MKKIILISVFCCFIGSTVVSQVWVNFTQATPEAPIITLTTSNNQQVAYTVEVCGMYKQDIIVANV